MPSDLSSVAREAARAHFDRRTQGIWRGWPDNQREDALEDLSAGFTECASRIPSEEEIAQVIAGELVDGDPRSAAEAVYALIGEKISG